ncbi:MAG: hypothetical protein DRO52_00665 [Candidatus Hecatellales archaeon]|nr:MAG: hypothetical protein DRO52_00665 [Candidatus Hecatellales archaeon]
MLVKGGLSTGLRNTVLALCIVAVVLLAVNLVLVLPAYSTFKGRQPQPMVQLYEAEKGGLLRILPAETPRMVEAKTINVVGVGTAKGKPDRAILTFSVIARGETATEAYQDNAEKINSVIATLKEAGIAEEQMETVGYRLNPIYRHPKGEEPTIAGYECRSSLKVTLTSLEGVGEIIDRAVKAGANQVSSVSFTLSEEERERLKAEALSLAVKDAKGKAETIARAAGISLVGPKSISLTSTPTPIIYRKALAEAAPVPTPPQIIPPEELSVTVTVSVVYEFK